ncbi:MAG: alpha-L-fucosidase [Armatimonadetes bacterium]|nr:alpha-L-fucosidase [Armatimonadota bacterium]
MTSTTDDQEIAAGPFAPTWESLRQFQCPEWFRDAKLAFWSHWGPQSVPMYGDWYARHLYVEGHDQYRHHWRVYGHPSQVGYKDIVPLWRAENFDPDGLMRLFVEAGAKYFVGQIMHHDNFDNFDSAHQRWNSVNVGPKRDITGLWRDAARAHGLPFGFSEHLGASFNWFGVNKGSDTAGPYAGVPYDGNDPEFADLYYRNQGYSLERGWYTDNTEFHRHWFARIKDAIDKYGPDLLYSDGGVPFGETGLRLIAHLYNTSAAHHGGVNRAVYSQKDTDPEVYAVGVLDIERGQRGDIAEHPWQTDTSVGDWFYNVRDVYKTPRHVLEMLVDIVSKNGNLLLNIPQRPDGTIDDECAHLLRRMAAWMPAHGEGLFGSRPWDVAGEGPTSAASGAFKEDAVDWTPEDFRFTRRGATLYAYQMRWPENGQAVIRALASGRAHRVTAVRLLGHADVPFQQTGEGLTITLSPLPPGDGPHGFAVTLDAPPPQ